MNCFDETEDVISFIEEHILEIDYAEISQLVGIPLGLYQRIFAYVCGISIADYIKRRRLTLAAYDLLAGGHKIIDIALKYGYESHAAFTRAFKEQIGIAPSRVSSSANLNLYPRLTFQLSEESYRVVKGRRLMAELERIEYAHFDARKVVGIEKRVTFQNAGEFWQEYFNSGASDRVEALASYVCQDIDAYAGLGYMTHFDEAGESFDYVIGKFMTLDAPVPEGLVSHTVPEGIVAVARIKGEFVDILNEAFFLMKEAIEKNGYVLGDGEFYWCDVYTYERYCEPIERGEKIVTLDYIMPCHKVNA